MAGLSLIEALADVPDPPSSHGRRHLLLALLARTVLALLHGCHGPTAIAQFRRDHGSALAYAPGFCRGKSPAASSLCTLYIGLDAVAFEAALSRWIASRLPRPRRAAAVSLDGKTLRGSHDGQTSGHHLVLSSIKAPSHAAALRRLHARPEEALALLNILQPQ